MESLHRLLEHGALFPLLPVDPNDRHQDLLYHKNRGNHKSVDKYSDKLEDMILDEITRGFALPLPIEILHLIPNASLAPLGCQLQETINEIGEKIPKFRMTHDQSFPGPSGNSVNNRVIKELLPPCMYSFVLLRSIHFIVNLRIRHPTTRIYLCKFDLDAAYRRCHLAGATAAESLTIFDNFLLMALRLTFGGTPCPSMWGFISDTLADISNTLIHNEFWDPSSLFDDLSTSLGEPIPLPDTIPFHPAKRFAIDLPINDIGKVDIYIDDSIGIALDANDNSRRVSYSIPLAIHWISRAADSLDPIPRKDIISLKKLLAEGRMEEMKSVLGWEINTRSLSISLPSDKHRNWTLQISKMIEDK